MKSPAYWIENLNLFPHPEGGYYREVYRSSENIKQEHLPERFSGSRNYSTSIYYLLNGDVCSRLHRIKSDELWHYYDGSCLSIYEIDGEGDLKIHKLGLDIEKSERPQIIVRAGNWFGAKTENENSFCLAGCTVAPGFDFADFELADRETLLKHYTQHKKIIEFLT